MKHQQEVIANVVQSNAVVITGETGCGKSTQIPHVLLAAMVQRTTTTSGGSSASSAADKVGVPLGVPLGEIICTQPRRISATSLARRVSVEMGDTTPLDKQHSFVGYSIRGESRKSRNTMLTYCTTGILLRRLQSDPLLSNVSIVIVDEVHERTVQSDFLFIALRRLLSIRKSGGFKVLLMSATMDSQKVSRYFGNAPVLHIPGRTFPVSVQYLEDIIEATEFTYVGKNLLYCCCSLCFPCSPCSFCSTRLTFFGIHHSNALLAGDDEGYGRTDQGGRGSIKLTRNTGRGGHLSYDANEKSYGINGAAAVVDESELDEQKYTLKTRSTVSRLYYESFRTTERIQYDLIVETLTMISNHSNYQQTTGAVLVFLSGKANVQVLEAISVQSSSMVYSVPPLVY